MSVTNKVTVIDVCTLMYLCLLRWQLGELVVASIELPQASKFGERFWENCELVTRDVDSCQVGTSGGYREMGHLYREK